MSINRSMDKLWYFYTMKNYSAINTSNHIDESKQYYILSNTQSSEIGKTNVWG